MEALRLEIEELGSGDAKFFGGKYTGGIHLMQIPKEITQCIKYLMDNDKSINSYLEIGSAGGGTAYVFNKFFDIKTMVLIDDNFMEQGKLRKDILAGINYSEFIGDSQSREAVEFVSDLDRTFDIVFIDASHTYAGASADVINYSQFVSPGGYLIMHDVFGEPGVRKLFSSMKNSREPASIMEFVDYNHWYPMGIGVIKRI